MKLLLVLVASSFLVACSAAEYQAWEQALGDYGDDWGTNDNYDEADIEGFNDDEDLLAEFEEIDIQDYNEEDDGVLAEAEEAEVEAFTEEYEEEGEGDLNELSEVREKRGEIQRFGSFKVKGRSKGLSRGGFKRASKSSSRGSFKGRSKGVSRGGTKGTFKGHSKSVSRSGSRGLNGLSRGGLKGFKGRSKGVSRGGTKGTFKGRSKSVSRSGSRGLNGPSRGVNNEEPEIPRRLGDDGIDFDDQPNEEVNTGIEQPPIDEEGGDDDFDDQLDGFQEGETTGLEQPPIDEEVEGPCFGVECPGLFQVPFPPSCECRCPEIESNQCPPEKMFDPELCCCVCRNIIFDCPPNADFNFDSCTCACVLTPADCGVGEILDSNVCSCVPVPTLPSPACSLQCSGTNQYLDQQSCQCKCRRFLIKKTSTPYRRHGRSLPVESNYEEDLENELEHKRSLHHHRPNYGQSQYNRGQPRTIYAQTCPAGRKVDYNSCVCYW